MGKIFKPPCILEIAPISWDYFHEKGYFNASLLQQAKAYCLKFDLTANYIRVILEGLQAGVPGTNLARQTRLKIQQVNDLIKLLELKRFDNRDFKSFYHLSKKEQERKIINFLGDYMKGTNLELAGEKHHIGDKKYMMYHLLTY